MDSLRTVATLLATGMVVAACSSGGIPDDAFPVVANADLATGPQRVLIGLVTPDASSLASPELEIEFDLYPPDSEDIASSAKGDFTWTVPDVRGLYRIAATFDVPGTWRVAAHTGPDHRGTPVPFNVASEALTPDVGDPAPAVATPTAPPEEISSISTDPNPDPTFYQTSLDVALDSGQPTVVVFSTPAFCETATCGPMLDTVKDAAMDHPDVTFIHVEVYENLEAPSREELALAEAVEAWNLPSEPWTFIVDSDGTITARLEGTLSKNELDELLGDLQ
jgi:hypothetical protein